MNRPRLMYNQPESQQAVNLLGHYAGLVSRALAFLIDFVIISLSVVVATWFVNFTMDMLQIKTMLGLLAGGFPRIAPAVDWILLLLNSSMVASLLVFAFVVAYHVFFWFAAGQTIGKALIGLRVVPLRGGKLKLWQAILRYAGYFISAPLLGIGFFWMLVDDRRMAWHDKLARTCVIYTWNARPDERFLQYAMRVLSSRQEAIRELKRQRTRLRGLLKNEHNAKEHGN